MTISPISITRRRGKRFLTMPLRVYYIDMPGAGIGGSNITGTGTKESIIALYDDVIGTTWRRDMYFWFQEAFTVDTIGGTLYDQPHMYLGWDDLRYKAYTDPKNAGTFTTARIMFQALGEDYNAAFSHASLPTFLGAEADAIALNYRINHLFSPDTHEYTPENGLMSGLMNLHPPGLNDGDDIWGFRLRWDWQSGVSNANQLRVEVGDFKTGDPDVVTWEWPDDVWCWLWDYEL